MMALIKYENYNFRNETHIRVILASKHAQLINGVYLDERFDNLTGHHHHHHHKLQGLDPLIRSVSRVTTALANVSSFFQLFFFLVVCSDMISKGFGFVAFFASVKASSVCIRLSYLVCIQSVVHGVRSRLFCGHEGCGVPEASITSFLPLQFFVYVRLSESKAWEAFYEIKKKH
jgi:hypothetical protein